MYQNYHRLRSLEIQLSARDLDRFTLNILYTIDIQLREMAKNAPAKEV